MDWLILVLSALVVSTCLFLVWVGWHVKKGVQPIAPPQPWQLYLPWGMLFDFEGFIGGQRKDGVTYVACVQVKAINRSNNFVTIRSARIISCITTEEIPVKIRTTSGYRSPEETNPIPGHARIYLQALFYDPAKNTERQGIIEEEFLRDFSEFIFEVHYDNRIFRKALRVDNIKAELHRLLPAVMSPRRVTAKQK